MKKSFIILIVVLALVVIGGGAYLVLNKSEKQIACTMEAKICPDGSAVGRTGPNCEFSPCPEIKESTTAKMNQKILNNGIYITPLEVIQDSRCPVDVQCIWAGTVTLRAKLESGMDVQEAVLTLNKPVEFNGKQIELVGVSPATHSKQTISQEEYVFEFSATERTSEEIGVGTLEGQMTIGPICPVERIDNPCKPTAEMFAARKIFVYSSDKKTLISTITPNAVGKFSITLPMGNYYLDMTHQKVGSITGVPTAINIESVKTVIINISVDTGIR